MEKFLKILGYVLIIVVPFSLVSFIVCIIIYRMQFKRKPMKHSLFPTYEDYQNLPRKMVSFKSKNKKLSGFIYGDSPTKGLIVISHGLAATHEKYLSHINYFVQKGYQVLGFDNTGSGISEGKSMVGLVQSAIDLNSAINYVRSDASLNKAPVFLFGHSWGGYAVLSILNIRSDIDSAVSICGYNSAPARFFERMKDLTHWFFYLQKPYMQLYQYILFGSMLNNDALSGLNKNNAKALIYQGGKDTVVKVATSAIYAKKDLIKNKNVKFILNEELGHNNILLSENARIKLFDFNNKKAQLDKQYQKKIPSEVLDNLFDSIDKIMINEPNIELLEESIKLFEAKITKE